MITIISGYQFNVSVYLNWLINDLSWLNTNYSYISKNPLQFYKYDAALLAADAWHALVLHHRKFYYNYFNQEYYPIYYDGMPRTDGYYHGV